MFLCFEFFLNKLLDFTIIVNFFDHFDVENNNVKVILAFRPLIYFKKMMAAGI